MSETKQAPEDLVQKSSKDILNELFSSFNASFEEDGVDKSHKKKKKSKKSKKSSKGSGGDASSGDEIKSKSEKKKSHKNKDRTSVEVQHLKGSKSNGKDKKKSTSKHMDEDDAEDVDELIAKHRNSIKKSAKIRVKEGIVSSIGDIVIKNDELLKSKKRKREEELRKLAGDGPAPDIEDGEILENDESNFSKHLKKDKSRKKHSVKLSASQAYKLDLEEKILLGLDSFEKSNNDSRRKSNRSHQDIDKHSSSSRSNSICKDSKKSHTERRKSEDSRHPNTHHINIDEKDLNRSSSRSKRLSKDEHLTTVRQAPPRESSRQAPPRDQSTLQHGPEPPPSSSSSSSRKSYNYKDTGWQKERDYESQSHGSSNSSSSRRRDGSRIDVDGYYDREADRRSDGRTGFGFVNRSYYDDPLEQRDRNRNHQVDEHHERDRYEHDKNRRKSRSPRRTTTTTSRSSRRSRSRSPHRSNHWRRSRSRSRERYRHPDDIIDKAKLLEIARKNAAKLMSRGVLPSEIFSRDQIVAIRAGGKSVEELTSYCAKLARKDARGDAISDDSGGSDGEGGEHFIHHPFHVKDRPMPQITLNIRNSIPIPVRTPQELAIEGAKLKVAFPVSSGTQHRIKELEWHPVVDKDEEEKKAKAVEDSNKSLVPLDGSKIESGTTPPIVQSSENQISEEPVEIEAPQQSITEKDITLDHPKPPEFDISDVIAIRLRAMRQLSENPTSNNAKKQLEDATQMMKEWADSKALEPKFLTQSELTQGPQAWAKRDQLLSAKVVKSPMGLHLLQKMGWKPGEGLGKNKGGDTEPLALEVKTDKKGLTSVLDYKKGPAMPCVFDLSAKHPISAIMELSAKRKWGSPEFELVFEHGPPHKKQFVYKVVLNGVEYQPCVAVNNKKLAKANAAAFCLQSLGLLPTCLPTTSDTVLQTVAPNPPLPVPHPSTANPTTAPSSNQSSMLRFSQPHYLQTVPTAAITAQPPLPPPELLMPPPPPPPLKKFS